MAAADELHLPVLHHWRWRRRLPIS
jgi:hypothetical protein